MSDEQVAELQAEQTETASETTDTATEVQEAAQPEAVPEKKFTQEELDEVVAKRLARERRKLEREQAIKPPPQAPVVPAQYETTEQYIEALAEAKATQKAHLLVQQQEKSKVMSSFFEREDEAAEIHPDYHQVTRSIPLTDDTLSAAMAAENSTDVLYHLGKNPREAERIARLPVYLQGFEVAKISAKLASAPKAAAVSKAPEPVKPVGPSGTATKKLEDMTDAEFAEHRRKYKQSRR